MPSTPATANPDTPEGAALLTPERIERVTISGGEAGIDQTVDHMARLAMGEYGAGSGRIINLARQIVADAQVPERDVRGEVEAVHAWVMAHLRYQRDPLWYEFVTYPETLAFSTPTGDCDDHVVLESALLGALGIPTRSVVWAVRNSPNFSHVSMQAQVPATADDGVNVPGKSQWLPLDPIMKDKPTGWEVPDATNKKVYAINTPRGVGIAGMSLSTALALVGGGWLIFKLYKSAAKKLGRG